MKQDYSFLEQFFRTVKFEEAKKKEAERLREQQEIYKLGREK